jgi:hypothetical protein
MDGPSRFVCAVVSAVVLAANAFGGNDGGRAPVVKVTVIDTAAAWASPCWGYNAPKILRNHAGELWAVNWFGKYGGHERARILKRTRSGTWLTGAIFDSLYQPSMIFLDQDGRVNYIQNSQTLPIRHYRSTDNENLGHFALVASGNGIADGRGWYVGAAVNGTTMYMAYVTLTYDLYYTWKRVRDSAWHPAVLVEAGVVDTASGNHAWLYPRFTFFGNRGYITASSTVDGSKQNTYDKVCMVSFSLDAPEMFEKEVVYEGAVGYYSYCYDTIITPDSLILAGFNAGRYKYGPQRSDVLPAGLYLASRKIGTKQWTLHHVDEGDGGLAMHWRPKDGLYAVVTRGSWDKVNRTLLKKSTDSGKSWTIVTEDIMAGYPRIQHQFFAQALRPGSGSVLDGDTVYALLTNHQSITPVEGLFNFDLLFLTIQLPSLTGSRHGANE